MTFNKAAWAIDGATVNSALARIQAYAATSGDEGIVQKSDLKVTALDVPGQGVQIAAGSALVLNKYQGAGTDETYTVSNPATHVLTPAEMPAASPAARSFILAVVVGDAEFSQAGHPFMQASDPPAGEEDTFTYVRPVMIEVAAGATGLNVSYPALPLARIDIPANTTTIQPSMIAADLRKLARPRSWMAVSHNPAPSTSNSLNGAGNVAGAYERWPDVAVLQVRIPSWAVKAKIMGFVEGAKLEKAGQATLTAYIEGTGLQTSVTNIDELIPTTTFDRRHYNVGGEIDVSTLAGTIQTFSVKGFPNNDGSRGMLWTESTTSVMLQVYFEEVPT